jgi:hypothetical protein
MWSGFPRHVPASAHDSHQLSFARMIFDNPHQLLTFQGKSCSVFGSFTSWSSHFMVCSSLLHDTLLAKVPAPSDRAKWLVERDTERYASVSASPALPEGTMQSAGSLTRILATAFLVVLGDTP